MLSCIYIMYFCFNLDFFIQRQFVIIEFKFDKKKIKYLDYWFDDIKTHCLHDFIFKLQLTSNSVNVHYECDYHKK